MWVHVIWKFSFQNSKKDPRRNSGWSRTTEVSVVAGKSECMGCRDISKHQGSQGTKLETTEFMNWSQKSKTWMWNKIPDALTLSAFLHKWITNLKIVSNLYIPWTFHKYFRFAFWLQKEQKKEENQDFLASSLPYPLLISLESRWGDITRGKNILTDFNWGVS